MAVVKKNWRENYGGECQKETFWLKQGKAKVRNIQKRMKDTIWRTNMWGITETVLRNFPNWLKYSGDTIKNSH